MAAALRETKYNKSEKIIEFTSWLPCRPAYTTADGTVDSAKFERRES